MATEGRPFARETIARAADLAREHGGPVHVLAIGRVHGASFGFPNPGLLPTRSELEQLYAEVDRTIEQLERKGVGARGEVLATRNGAKRIARRAQGLGCKVIVMAADPKANPMVRNFMWSQEPQRVARRSKVPVDLVEVQ